MEFYVEQLKAITDLLETLNEWEKRHPNAEIMLDQPIRIVEAGNPETLLMGTLVDEIGGVWSFKPAVH